jgi:nicotinate-nucleotide--dimethylbenzimidazole phosphoribosyltransferase
MKHSRARESETEGLRAALQRKIDRKTKPPGALGRLETIALQLGLLQNTLAPEIRNPQAIIFAGDHGISAEGVSPYPAEVTGQMVRNFLAGGAAINVFARRAGLQLTVVDAGVATDLSDLQEPFADNARFVRAKIRPGSRNLLREDALSSAEVGRALATGADIINAAAQRGANLFVLGEMGIGNTSSAALLAAVLAPLDIGSAVGRGAGLDDAGLERKLRLLTEARARYAGPLPAAPETALAQFGGYEIAMLCGAMLAAAQCRAAIIVDGFICTAAYLAAWRMNPAVQGAAFFAHRSAERAHAAVLKTIGAQPLLDLDMRLGEGSGAALAAPILAAAADFLRDMASFESAGVSDRSEAP